MLKRVFLPQLGQTMEEGTVEKWHKAEGEQVRKGEVLYELTTDKATLEVEAFASGVLKKILVEEGRTVPVNELIAVLGDEGDELPDDLSELRGGAAPAAAAEAQDAAIAAARPAEAQAAPEAAPGQGRAFASPRARKVAEELKVPLEALRGSGPGGRVVERDVTDYAARLAETPHTPTAAALAHAEGLDLLQVAAGVDGRVRRADVEAAVAAGGGRREGAAERIPLSAIRHTIAERMTASKRDVPHFYLVGDVAMGAALALLRELERQGRKATVTALLVKAVGLVLAEHPRMNARFDGDAVVLNAERNVGVAVAVEDGLFVPVIRRADAKDLPAISAELRSLAEAAREGRLIPGQYEGGSITVSNLGMFGVTSFLPIINPPEACIIGVGAIANRVVATEEGGMRVEPMMSVSLSADHRVTDGAEAARFFQTLKGLLEAPGPLAAS
jgi:pyruvate dehydrogenase E2 component (dihydrolipoamide acetyltransferase)